MEKVEIIRTLSNGSIAIKCGFCKGSGNYPQEPYDDELVCTDPCPVCSGKGINIFWGDGENLIICRCCDGSGRAWDDGGYFVGDTCGVCKGTGIIKLELDDTTIPFWNLIHPDIKEVAQTRFHSCHHADSVEAALKEINTAVKRIVRERTGQEYDGSDLMNRAFSLKNPVLELGDLSAESGQNIQKGYLQLFSGAMTGIRNPNAHENLTMDRNRAIHLLFLASLLMFKVSESKEF